LLHRRTWVTSQWVSLLVDTTPAFTAEIQASAGALGRKHAMLQQLHTKASGFISNTRCIC